ncbi:MAG: alpha-ketoglutarate-dependent dioxygenase AlkB [Myxococcota bacterium]
MRPAPDLGLKLQAGFVSPAERAAVLAWLATLHPLWELRWSTVRPLPAREEQRPLLRPVYWLGNWQFACLGYYHPPKGLHDRCVAAEPFPPPLRAWVNRIEAMAHRSLPKDHVPRGWTLNTCLVNFYGDRVEDDKREDRARVGAHRDFEPGPVASISLGSRAVFQFTTPKGEPLKTMWLDDGSLQLFAGPQWKDRAFHRVQRVDRKGEELPPSIPGFRTRRVNFTFRYVPEEFVVPYARLGPVARADVRGYVRELAAASSFWAAALAEAGEPLE